MGGRRGTREKVDVPAKEPRRRCLSETALASEYGAAGRRVRGPEPNAVSASRLKACPRSISADHGSGLCELDFQRSPIGARVRWPLEKAKHVRAA